MRINVNIIALGFVNTYSIILFAFVFVGIGFGIGLGFGVGVVGRVMGLSGLIGGVGVSPLG